MTLLELWVHTPLARSLGFALAHSLWEGALIAAALAAVLCVARSSGARYGAACVAMLLLLASFGVTLVRLMPESVDLTAAPRHLAVTPGARAGLPMVPNDEGLKPSVLAGVLPWIAPFWAAGVLFFHLRSLGGWITARRLRRSGVCLAAGEWQRRLEGLAARLRVSRPAVILESCLADAPAVIGYARPVILMPVGMLTGLPVAHVEAILIHELAHIRRRDYLVNLMQTFVEGLLFYHPAVWWISGVIRAERENCCDDLAVAATGDARGYAAALVALEQNRSAAHEMALAATGGSLVKRIQRLLQKPERPRAAWTPVIPAGLLVAGAAVAFASWQTPVPNALPDRATTVAVEAPAAPISHDLAGPISGSKPALSKRTPTLLAQARQTTQPSQSVEQQLREALQREDTKHNELTPPYKKWLNEDVAYIVTDEERNAFKESATDEEREQFIKQFWARRDPTPGTAENEFKEEHYRRIAYANEHYAALVPGWKTDRGRIYITFGPPDEIEDHSSGGAYVRPPQEGGGTTETYPFQQWRYRFIDGIGKNVVIEFIDPTYTKEFRMTTDPSEKDALALVQPPGTGGRGVSGPPSSRAANTFVSVGDGPKVMVSVTSGKTNTRVNVVFPSGSGKHDIIGRITDVGNQAVANLRDFTVAGQLSSGYGFTIKPGSYTLTLLTRDQASGAIQTSAVNFYVN